MHGVIFTTSPGHINHFVHCRKVVLFVIRAIILRLSSSWRVLYWRFHCTGMIFMQDLFSGLYHESPSFTFPSTLGVAPPSFFFIRAGTTLYELTTASGHISFQSILILAVMAVLSLLPVLCKKTLKRRMD